MLDDMMWWIPCTPPSMESTNIPLTYLKESYLNNIAVTSLISCMLYISVSFSMWNRVLQSRVSVISTWLLEVGAIPVFFFFTFVICSFRVVVLSVGVEGYGGYD